MRSHVLVFLVAAIAISALAAPPARAQVVNVQPLIGDADAEGFGGEARFRVDYRRGNVDLFQGGASLLLRYATGVHRIISSSSAELGYKGDSLPEPETRFLERVFTHLRYQVALTDWVEWEVYGQVATDAIKQMRLRVVAGTGARFEVYADEQVNLAIGISGMFEREVEDTVTEETDPDTGEVREVLGSEEHLSGRLSAYLSLRLRITDTLSLTHTSYFQPNFGPFESPDTRPFIDDFRYMGQTSLTVSLPLGLGLNVGVDLAYDQAPPAPVEPFDLTTRLELVASF